MITSVTHNGRTAALTCHMAVLSGNHRRNGRAAVEECFAADVPRLEIDIHSLDGRDYIVTHDRHLQDHTTGAGSIGSVTPEQVRQARFKDDRGDRPLLLSELVELSHGSSTQVQLDLKDWRLMPADRIGALFGVIAPIHDRVILSTGQDWNMARIHAADPSLALGFDPGHYLARATVSAIEGEAEPLPRAAGAYGYRDDHPLAVGRTEDIADYLDARMAGLLTQVPYAREFFLNYRMILQMLDDGFDVTSWLHGRKIDVTAWTPDYRDRESLDALRRLIDARVDRITTNTIPAWVGALA